MWNKLQPAFGTFRTDRDPGAREPEARPRPTCSIVVPSLNEERSLPSLVEQIEGVLTNCSYEVVFVDDGSTDRTWQLIQQAVRRRPNWQAIRLTRSFGHRAAVWAGLVAARGAATIVMNADGRHPAAVIPKMIACWRGGARVVEMLRREPTDASRLRRSVGRACAAMRSLLAHGPIRVADEDFRLIDRSVLDLILQSRGPVPSLRELVPWLGCRTVELQYDSPATAGGRPARFGQLRLRNIAGAIRATARRTPPWLLPVRLCVCAGLIFSLMSFSCFAYLLGRGLFSPAIAPAWASTAALVALLGGIQLMCLGLMGEHLARMFEVSWDRPPYVIRQDLKPGAPLRNHPPGQLPALSSGVRGATEPTIGDRIGSLAVTAS